MRTGKRGRTPHPDCSEGHCTYRTFRCCQWGTAGSLCSRSAGGKGRARCQSPYCKAAEDQRVGCRMGRKGKGESHTCNTEEIGQNHRAKERRKRRMTLL